MTVGELSALRALLREGDFEYRVIKNTLALIASEGTPVSLAKDSFQGPVGLAFSYDDPVIPVKKLLEYSKKNDKLKIGAGVIEGSLCSSDELKAVAETPPRPVLLSMFIGGLQSPLNNLAYALSATLSKIVYALEALKKQKTESEQK